MHKENDTLNIQHLISVAWIARPLSLMKLVCSSFGTSNDMYSMVNLQKLVGQTQYQLQNYVCANIFGNQ